MSEVQQQGRLRETFISRWKELLMSDRQTKALLLAIAIGLWANVATQWLRPKALHAQDTAHIEQRVDEIAGYVGRIAHGTCTNGKIC
jgi:hypothetical protein